MSPRVKQTTGNLPGPGPGRPKGVPNRTTALLKDAILQAAEAVGADKQGLDGLKGYCTYLATEEPKAFAQLLGKVLPTQVTGEDGGPVQAEMRIAWMTEAEAKVRGLAS